MMKQMNWQIAGLAIALILMVLGGLKLSHVEGQPTIRELTLVNIKYEGTNVWVPGPLVVKKGERVRLRGINNVKDDPAEHGLSIKEFGVTLVVNRGKPESTEFVADKAGIFRLWCHLHLPHIGTQLIVLE